jgi:hypothetical protein
MAFAEKTGDTAVLIRFWRVALLATIAAMMSHAVEAQQSKVESAITMIRTLDRPGRINLATIWDGNKYVQCRLLHDRNIFCEAAGTRMQPSLEHILTPDKSAALIARGWVVDPAFGNFARTFTSDVASGRIADEIIGTLSAGYGADPTNLVVSTSTVADEACPPRYGWTQNLAGMIRDSSAMKGVSIHACSYLPESIEPERKLGRDSTLADLIALYQPKLGREIERLRLNIHRNDVFVVFDAGIGYVQCMPETDPAAFYCEAQSADSWPPLASVLTPERIGRLHALGYADPGSAQNYTSGHSH